MTAPRATRARLRPRPVAPRIGPGAAAVAWRLALCLLLGLARARTGGAEPDDDRPPEITKGELQALVKAFSSDALEGREAGSPGCDVAARMVADEFARVGLAPLGDGGTWFQEFTIPRGMKVLPACALEATDTAGKTLALRLLEDFVPLDVSAPGDVAAEAVFVGYGIVAPDAGYDDYEGIDVRGKVAVALRHAPAYRDRKSPFSTAAALGRYATFQAKAEAAAAAGAVALIVVNDPASSGTAKDDALRDPGGGAAGKIPVVQVTWRAGRRLGPAIDVPFVRRQQQIDGKVAPASGPLPGVTVRVHCALEPDVRRVRNVVGLLERSGETTVGGAATSATARETLVVGAHYDHVGLGKFGSLANADGKIHNGADDNASGTSSLLEIAGWLASRRRDLSRRVLFLAFTGEELGLLGSKHYVEHPIVPLADTVAMLNLDMVGRLRDGRLFVGGTGTSPVWSELLEDLNRASGRFRLTSWPGGKAPSDHASFYEHGVPVLFFFTGLHGDYHRPSDDWNTLEYDGQARVARFAAEVALDVATRKERPVFTKCDAGGFEVGPYLGVSVEPRADGLFVVHVDDKSPAKRAGFREEDRLVSWGGAPVADANAYNEALSKAKPGERVEVVVARKGRTVRLTVTLGST